MNAEQFQQFMKTFQENQQLMFQHLQDQLQQTERDTVSHQTDAISNINSFENFDMKKEKFICYLERFQNYLAMKNITDNKKRTQMLLHSIGSTHYNTVSALVKPRILSEFSYKELVKVFTAKLSPKRSIVVSQHYFLSTYQSEKQSIADFVATLQWDMTECQFEIEYTCECRKEA